MISTQIRMTLQHPLHKHALIRKQLSEHFSYQCSICKLDICGTTYCCQKKYCYFFLHEPCALVEIPQQITKHPIHPEHPLVILSQYLLYQCHLCNINFDVSVVIASMPPLEEENIIQHVAHDHPLIAFHVKVPNWTRCKGCCEMISGPAYGCHTCCFFLDESCAQLPRERLQHPFHPEHPLTLLFENENFRCNACHIDSYSQLAYYCHKCEFKLDVTCAVLPLLLQDQEKEDIICLDHFSHQHQLLSGHVEEREHIKLSCAVCELKISGEVYYCLGCILFLHKLCAEELPIEMEHYLHPEHRLILLPKPLSWTGSFRCACCQNGYSGMAFHCVSCSFHLDPKCALQTFSALRDEVPSQIQYFDHDHPLILHYFKKQQTPDALHYTCDACCKPITDLANSCNSCVYALHKSCAELPLQLEHPFHPHHRLILLLKVPAHRYNCNVCTQNTEGIVFYCSECDFYLCKRCAETPSLKHQLHEHTLSYFHICIFQYSRCPSCGKLATFDLYRCRPCNFNIHGSCLPLPPTIQHECHPYHPLVLFDRFVDGRHDDDDQYCDYCEEIRNPDHGVYRCEECWYTVHIGCVLPLVTRPVNPEIDKLRKEIASLEAIIKEKQKDLKALKEKLSSLEEDTNEFSD